MRNNRTWRIKGKLGKSRTKEGRFMDSDKNLETRNKKYKKLEEQNILSIGQTSFRT